VTYDFPGYQDPATQTTEIEVTPPPAEAERAGPTAPRTGCDLPQRVYE